jgi:hypothetical protein
MFSRIIDPVVSIKSSVAWLDVDNSRNSYPGIGPDRVQIQSWRERARTFFDSAGELERDRVAPNCLMQEMCFFLGGPLPLWPRDPTKARLGGTSCFHVCSFSCRPRPWLENRFEAAARSFALNRACGRYLMCKGCAATVSYVMLCY